MPTIYFKILILKFGKALEISGKNPAFTPGLQNCNKRIHYFFEFEKKKTVLPLNEVSDYLMDNLTSDPYFEGDKIQLKLQEAILKLPEKQRIVFNLKYFDEMKYDDMAQILDTSVGALKASYHHAVKKVEEYIKNTD